MKSICICAFPFTWLTLLTSQLCIIPYLMLSNEVD